MTTVFKIRIYFNVGTTQSSEVVPCNSCTTHIKKSLMLGIL